MTETNFDPRPCKGRNSNICVAEGCYNQSCVESWLENPVENEKTGQHRKDGHDSNGTENGPESIGFLVVSRLSHVLFWTLVGASLCFLGMVAGVAAGINDRSLIYTDLMWQLPLLAGILYANLEFYVKERDNAW